MGWMLAVLLAANGGLDLGPELDRVQVGSVAYVALASGGVALIDLSGTPREVRRFATDRRVARLVLTGDALLLVETRYEVSTWSVARPLEPVASALEPGRAGGPETAPPAAPPASAPPPPPAPAAEVQARVAEVRAGRAIFEAGLEEGFKPGARVRVISQRLEAKPDLATGELVRVPSGETSAVVRIEQADAHRSMARLGRGDVAEPGDLAATTGEPLSERLFMPRRAPFRWLAGVHARPFLGLEASSGAGASKPIGVLLDAYGAYYFDDFPVAIGLSAAPVGIGFGAREAHYPATLAATASYVTDYFEIGLGAGALFGNEGPCFVGPLGASSCEVNTGFTINQQLRLGALDGINIGWRSSIFSRPDRFVFGVGRGEVNMPITSQLGLFGAGGGGENGWGFGEFGVRTFVGGTGARGTMLISASLGYAAIFDGPSHETIGGPSVAFGIEWRR